MMSVKKVLIVLICLDAREYDNLCSLAQAVLAQKGFKLHAQAHNLMLHMTVIR